MRDHIMLEKRRQLVDSTLGQDQVMVELTEGPLANPVNDARDMAATLRQLGFDVLSGQDRNLRQMEDLIREFGRKIRSGGVGMFYFAGHGVQVGGANYLIPIGAQINGEAEVNYSI